jgi:hypothetical protein
MGEDMSENNEDLKYADLVQVVLNVRCRVILDNKPETIRTLRGVLERASPTILDTLTPLVRERMDRIIDDLTEARFEAIVSTQITIERATEEDRKGAQDLGPPST